MERQEASFADKLLSLHIEPPRKLSHHLAHSKTKPTHMSLQDSLQFAKDYSALLSVATFLIGLIVGNKQAIGRDRRKEFNEVSENVFVVLNKQLACIATGSQGESADDFLLTEAYIPFYERSLFRMHVKRYKAALQGVSTYHVETGTVTFDQVKLKHLARCTKNLLSYLQRR